VSATPGPSTDRQVDPAASQVQVETSLPKGTTPSDSISMTSDTSSTVKKGPASDQPVPSVPTSAAAQVSSVDPVVVNDGDDGAVTTSSQQIQQSPASGSLGQSSTPQAPVPGNVNNPVPAKPTSPVSVPRAPVSSQKVVTTPSVTPSPASPEFAPTGPNPQSMSPSLASTGQVGITQASQVPPSQDQVPVKTPASPALVSQSSAQQKPKPPPKRQSFGLNFLQLDLKVAREKKLKAALVAEQQKSGSAPHASAVPGPSTTTATAPDPAVPASPTSTAIAGSPITPPAPSFTVAAQATPVGPLPTIGSTPVPSPATISGDSNTTQSPTQILSPSLVHRDLRQGLTRNGTSGARLRITDRAPAPGPEPGSSSAPIVIDEEDEPMPTSTDEAMEVDVPTEALPTPGKTTRAIEQGVQGSEADTGHEDKPQLDQVGKPKSVSSSLRKSSVLQVTSSSLVEPPATVNLRTDVITTQGPSAPSISSPRPSFATSVPAIPASAPLASSDSETTGVQPQPAKDDNEQGKVAEGSVETFGISTTENVSGTTIEPLLSNESSTINMGSTHTTDDTEMAPPSPATTATATAVTESPAVPVDTAEPCSLSNAATPHGIGEHATTITVSSVALITGKHQRPPTPSDIGTRRVIPRKASIPESQQDTPTVVLQPVIVGPTSAAPATLDMGRRGKEGSSETAVDLSLDLGRAVSMTSSNKATTSMLPPPSTRPHPRSESLSDMDISRSSVTPPPIAVLGIRSGGSTATNASSDSRSPSPQSGRRPSEAGAEPVKAEELEDEMVDELSPQFGKEMRVICMDRTWDVPGEFTWNFTLPQVDWDRVSQWAKAPENVE
jgi:hypothetical protein